MTPSCVSRLTTMNEILTEPSHAQCKLYKTLETEEAEILVMVAFPRVDLR